MMRINLILTGVAMGFFGCGWEGAIAQTARVSGVASLTSGSTISETFDATTGNLISRTVTGGVVTSVSGETNLPYGLFFGGNVNVTPIFGTISGGTLPVVSGLVINPGVVGVVPENATFSRAAAQILINSAADPATRADLEEITALIRAGAGVNGLD